LFGWWRAAGGAGGAAAAAISLGAEETGVMTGDIGRAWSTAGLAITAGGGMLFGAGDAGVAG